MWWEHYFNTPTSAQRAGVKMARMKTTATCACATVACFVLLSTSSVVEAFSRCQSFQTRRKFPSPKQLPVCPLQSSSSSDDTNSNNADASSRAPSTPTPPEPFLPALDAAYSVNGKIGGGSFVISRLGAPTKQELSNENLLRILFLECNDLEVNTLVWKCLGYRFDADAEEWNSAECFPKWREKYPSPPDLIGMSRIYSKERDQPSLKANQALVRSVPADNKQSLKAHLKPYGFKGYKVSGVCLLMIMK